MLTDYIHALECIFFKLSRNDTDFSGLNVMLTGISYPRESFHVFEKACFCARLKQTNLSTGALRET